MPKPAKFQTPRHGFGDKLARGAIGVIGAVLILAGLGIVAAAILLEHGYSRAYAVAGAGSIGIGRELLLVCAVLPRSKGSIAGRKLILHFSDERSSKHDAAPLECS